MKAKFEYSIVIEYCGTEKCYIARVPDLGPYITAFGETYEDALREIQTVIELTLQSFKEDGISPPRRKDIKKAI